MAIPNFEKLFQQAREISTGTLANLTGLTQYDQLERTHRLFLQHLIATSPNSNFASWIEAWRWFANGDVAADWPRYQENDGLLYLAEWTVEKDRQSGETLYLCKDGSVGRYEEAAREMNPFALAGLRSFGNGALIRQYLARQLWEMERHGRMRLSQTRAARRAAR